MIIIAAGVTLCVVAGTGAFLLVQARQEAAWEQVLADARAATPVVLPLEGPFTVALQPGHWKIDEVPAELRRRPRSSGAEYAGVRELDINLAVVDVLVPLLESEGWRVIVVPATVPPGLRADAFISIHADWAGDVNRRGWKLAPPWRPSQASSSLARSIASVFAERTELREDVGGITVGMRGYFGFSWHRYRHASSPFTPATLVELGFVTNTSDRVRMATNPAYYAEILHEGLKRFRYSTGRAGAQALIPRVFDYMVVGPEGAELLARPDEGSRTLRALEPGEIVQPVDATDGWYEVRLRAPNQIGWVAAARVERRGTS